MVTFFADPKKVTGVPALKLKNGKKIKHIIKFAKPNL